MKNLLIIATLTVLLSACDKNEFKETKVAPMPTKR